MIAPNTVLRDRYRIIHQLAHRGRRRLLGEAVVVIGTVAVGLVAPILRATDKAVHFRPTKI